MTESAVSGSRCTYLHLKQVQQLAKCNSLKRFELCYAVFSGPVLLGACAMFLRTCTAGENRTADPRLLSFLELHVSYHLRMNPEADGRGVRQRTSTLVISEMEMRIQEG